MGLFWQKNGHDDGVHYHLKFAGVSLMIAFLSGACNFYRPQKVRIFSFLIFAVKAVPLNFLTVLFIFSPRPIYRFKLKLTDDDYVVGAPICTMFLWVVLYGPVILESPYFDVLA